MLDVGGQDATEAFEDVGHSDEARETLEQLLVGTLKRQVNLSLSPSAPSSPENSDLLTPDSLNSPATPSPRPRSRPTRRALTPARPAWARCCTPSFSSAASSPSVPTSTCRASRRPPSPLRRPASAHLHT